MKEQALAQWFYRELTRIAQRDPVSPAASVQALYQLLQQLLLERTEGERLLFNTLFARMAYAFQQYDLPRPLQSHLHAFRKAAQESGPKTPADLPRLGLTLLAQAVFAFYQQPIPDELRPFLLAQLPPPANWRRSHAFRKSIRVVLLEKDAKARILLAREEDQPEGAIRIAYDLSDYNEPFTPSIQLLGTHLRLPLSAQLIDVDIDEEGLHKPRALVLEPDFLFDITAVSECFQPGGAEPFLYLLKKYLPFSSSPALLLGHIANFFLDELLTNPDATFGQSFPRAFFLNPLAFSLLDDQDIRDLQTKAKEHFANLIEILRQRLPEEGIQAERCLLEPTFYSPVYGIQGRLDFFHHQPPHAHIVELKSGKPFGANIHQIGVSHFTQTLLYGLLIQQVVDPQTKLRSYILYSGETASPLRFAPPVRDQQYEALQVRNLMLFLDRQMAQTYATRDAGPLEESPLARLLARLNPARLPDIKGFARNDLVVFEKTWAEASTLEKRYFLAFSGFVAREHQLAKTGIEGLESSRGQTALWTESLDEKEEAFEVLAWLTIAQNQAGDDPPVLVMNRTAGKTNPLANFRKGDLGILYPAQGRVLDHQLYKCTIVDIQAGQVTLRLRSRQFNASVFDQVESWHVEHDLLDSSFQGLYRSLYAFLQSPARKRSLLLGLDAPGASAPVDPGPIPGLSGEQHRVLSKILASPDYFLLWGPPGTGKTSVLLKHLVKWLYENTSENLLLLAYTNRAVDEICDALESIGPQMAGAYLRIGSSFACDPRYKGQLLDEKIASVRDRKGIQEVLQRHRIFTGTLASVSGKPELFQLKTFQRLIIDEASQILEPALAGLLPLFEKFVLIGDHKQLPAVVAQTDWASRSEDPLLQEVGLHNLRHSLFERLFKRAVEKGWTWAYERLSIQGRMHRDLMDFPNRHFYEGLLDVLHPDQDPRERQVQPLTYASPYQATPLEQSLMASRKVFIPTPADESGPNSKTNVAEALGVVEVIRAFSRIWEAKGRSVHAGALGVITPYRAQIAQIRAALHEAGLDPDRWTIDTVERYQGGARDIILISLCTNSVRQLENMISRSEEGIDRKLNVALTRAREHLVVLGNPEILEQDPTYRDLMGWMDRVF